jgi:hypothetical protein
MHKLSLNDGTWDALVDDWGKICQTYDEDFDGYMTVSIPTLKQQCVECVNDNWSGSFALKDGDGKHIAAAFLNAAHIKGFSGRVLRVRHLVMSPSYDFGEFDEDMYAKILMKIVADIVIMSDEQLLCPNLKFHFRSPADLVIFRTFAEKLDVLSRFSLVAMVGSWLHIEK